MSRVTATHRENEKTWPPTWVGEAETHSRHKRHAQHRVVHPGGNSQIPVTPSGVKGLDLISSVLTCKSPARCMAPKTSGSGSQWGLYPQASQQYSRWRMLHGCISMCHGCSPLTRLGAEGTGKIPHLWVFPWKAWTAYITSCCLRVQLLISLHLGADCNPPP